MGSGAGAITAEYETNRVDGLIENRSTEQLFPDLVASKGEDGIIQPDQLAEQLLLLLEGAITMAQINGSPLSAEQAKRAAKVLIENATTVS